MYSHGAPSESGSPLPVWDSTSFPHVRRNNFFCFSLLLWRIPVWALGWKKKTRVGSLFGGCCRPGELTTHDIFLVSQQSGKWRVGVCVFFLHARNNDSPSPFHVGGRVSVYVFICRRENDMNLSPPRKRVPAFARAKCAFFLRKCGTALLLTQEGKSSQTRKFFHSIFSFLALLWEETAPN